MYTLLSLGIGPLLFSHQVMSYSFATHTLCSSTRLLCPRDFPGKNSGVGCHFLLQRIFPTQGSSQPCIVSRFFSTEPPRKSLSILQLKAKQNKTLHPELHLLAKSSASIAWAPSWEWPVLYLAFILLFDNSLAHSWQSPCLFISISIHSSRPPNSSSSLYLYVCGAEYVWTSDKVLSPLLIWPLYIGLQIVDIFIFNSFSLIN